jgi:hypothetical protein
MDNIGGIISASFVVVENVKNCAVVGIRILVEILSGKSWTDFPHTPGKIDITVVPDEGVNPLYTVSGTIYCARGNQEKYNDITSKRLKKILLKYTTGNGDVLVAGDKLNPLTVRIENVNPSAANGYSGTKITISGVMTHPELVLIE